MAVRGVGVPRFAMAGTGLRVIPGVMSPMARLALAVRPVPPGVELTAPVVSVAKPGVALVTLTETVQLVLAASEPPLSESVVPPEIAAAVPPQPVLVRLAALATVIPAGRVSLNATLDWEKAVGLANVMVRDEEPPAAMDDGLNAAAMLTGTGLIVIVSVFEVVVETPAPLTDTLLLTFPLALPTFTSIVSVG